MKYLCLLSFLLFSFFISFSQSKEDKQDLIKQKIETLDGYDNSLESDNEFLVSFDSCFLTFVSKRSFSWSEDDEMVTKYIIPLSRIKKFAITGDTSDGFYLYFKVNPGSNDQLIKYYNYKGAFSLEHEMMHVIYNEEPVNEGLNKLLQKTFSQLAELCGDCNH